MDLSFPHGASVNDGISSDLLHLSYITVDDVAENVQQLGRGALLAKMDIQSAYRLIPVHPQDCVLQGMEWRGHVYRRSQAPVWPQISSQDFQLGGRCPVLVP